MSRVFRFHHVWSLDVPAGAVYAVLANADQYAVWWPQVRSTERIDDESGWVTVRSVLPYTLRFLVRREVEDPRRGLLRIAVAGDLQGWCQWQVDETASGSQVVFDQEAVMTPRLLARTAGVTAPLVHVNHAWMMRGARAGLTAYLSGARN